MLPAGLQQEHRQAIFSKLGISLELNAYTGNFGRCQQCQRRRPLPVQQHMLCLRLGHALRFSGVHRRCRGYISNSFGIAAALTGRTSSSWHLSLSLINPISRLPRVLQSEALLSLDVLVRWSKPCDADCAIFEDQSGPRVQTFQFAR